MSSNYEKLGIVIEAQVREIDEMMEIMAGS